MEKILISLLLVLISFTKVESGELPYRSIHITTLEVQVVAHRPITDRLLWIQRKVESGHKQTAVSKCGAMGVAQFMPSTWRDLKKRKILPKYYDIHNEQHQKLAQRRYMEYLYNFDYKAPKNIPKLELAIAAYNCGPGRVRDAISIDPLNWDDHIPEETQNYLTRIFIN